MWDSVPWLVGGGAEHSPEVARLLAYAATSGAEGIVSPGDLKVQALTVPGAQVRVMPGACLIRSRAAAAAQETYVGRNVGQDTVDIAATGSGSGRSDLIVARVEDPFVAGEPWSEPSDPKVGPYIFTRVIPGVAAGATEMPAGMTGIPLARIDVPANTATITNSMITDLRAVALPREHRSVHVETSTVTVPTPAGAGWAHWLLPSPEIEIPHWATHATVVTTITGIAVGAVNINRTMSTGIGALRGTAMVVDFDNATPARSTREVLVATARGSVASQAGERHPIVVSIQGTGLMTFTPTSQVVHDIAFYERRI